MKKLICLLSTSKLDCVTESLTLSIPLQYSAISNQCCCVRQTQRLGSSFPCLASWDWTTDDASRREKIARYSANPLIHRPSDRTMYVVLHCAVGGRSRTRGTPSSSKSSKKQARSENDQPPSNLVSIRSSFSCKILVMEHQCSKKSQCPIF